MKKSEKAAYTEEDDINLIQKIAQRDAGAFAIFYDHNARTVFSFLSCLVKNRVENEDILQETFWRVWQQAAAFDAASGTSIVWVLTLARNLGLARLKHLSSSRQDDASAEAISIAPDFLATLSPIAPPAFVRANLLSAMAQEKKISPRLPVAPPAKRKSWLARFPWLMAIGWSMAGIFGAIFFGNINADWQAALRQDDDIASLRLTLSQKEEAMSALRLTLSEKEDRLALMEAQRTLAFALTGASGALSKVFWNPQMNTGLFIAFDLPILQNGKVYQVWAVQKGGSVDAGVFSFSERTGSFKVKSMLNPTDEILSFTVTAEPSGGSQRPTGKILLQGGRASQ